MQRAGQVLMQKHTGQIPKEKEEEDEVAQLKRKQKTVQAQFDYVNTVDSLQNPPSIQAMREKAQQEAREERERAQKAAEEVLERERQRLADDAQAAAQKAHEEEQRRVEAEQQLQKTQTQMLLEKLEELKQSKKPMEEQLDEYMSFAERIAEKMGFQKSDTKVPGDNPQVTLEITRLNLDQQQRDREFQWQIQKDKQEFELKLLQLKDERAFREQQLKQQSKRDEQIFNLPQILSAAIAQGLVDRHQEAPAGPMQAPPPSQYRVPAGEGATIACPNCQSPIGIAPDTSEATCAMCNTQFHVSRQPGPPPPQTEEEQ